PSLLVGRGWREVPRLVDASTTAPTTGWLSGPWTTIVGPPPGPATTLFLSLVSTGSFLIGTVPGGWPGLPRLPGPIGGGGAGGLVSDGGWFGRGSGGGGGGS